MTLRLLRRRRGPAIVRARDDAEAFGEFYDAYAERVLVFFVRRVFDPEAALDLTAEVFALAWEHRHQFRGENAEQEQGWLFAIVRNLLGAYWRRGQLERGALTRLEVVTPRLQESEVERLLDLAELDQRAPEIRDALAAIPPEQRTAVELRVLSECSYAEIADRLNVSQDVVRARVSRGLRALARDLHDDLHEADQVGAAAS